MNLTALASDYNLDAESMLKADPVTSVIGPVYLLDTAGNFLTDPSGNKLIAFYQETVVPISLDALVSDYNLDAE